MSNFSNKHIKVFGRGQKTGNKDTPLKIQVLKNQKNIKACIEERIKNDKDIDAIRFAISSNQKIIKDMLEKIEYLEEKTENYRLQYIQNQMDKPEVCCAKDSMGVLVEEQEEEEEEDEEEGEEEEEEKEDSVAK